MNETIQVNQRFMAFLNLNKDNPQCWEWRKGVDRDGYGHVEYDGKTRIAHRAAYLILKGAITPGKMLCHRCDNRACCNPSHLFEGDAKINYEDARSKGRAAIGERNGASRLSAGQVMAIRADRRTQMEIAASYGIRQTAVSSIKTGRNWRHLA